MNGWKAAALGIVATGIAARGVWLDRLPGINGDEAWYGVNVNALLAGRDAFLQTPSGNVVNPVHSFPLLLISLVAEPALLVLRMPEVFWGILAVLLAYPLLRRPLGATAAALSVVLLAVSPTAVIHTRIGWDPTGTQLPSLLAVAFAFTNRPLLAAGCVAIAYLVHPTNVFLAPTVLMVWAPHGWRRYNDAPTNARRSLRRGALLATALGIPIAAWLVSSMARMQRLPSIEMVTGRVVSLDAWLDSGWSIVRLASGVTAATYTAGPVPARLAMLADVLSLLLLAAAAGVAIRASRVNRSWPGLPLAAGMLASFVAFHVVAGPVALAPGLERYAMSFVVPLAIMFALTIDALGGFAPPAMPQDDIAAGVALGSKWQGVIPGSLCGAWLASAAMLLGAGYFYPLLTWGGEAHATFRTGREEPKAAAYEFIASDSGEDEVVAVYAEDWWIYWPMRYLALPEWGRIFVEMIGETPPLYPPGASTPAYPRPPERIYAVVFDSGGPYQRVRDVGRLLFTARDPIGRPILHVFALDPAGSNPFGSQSR